MTAVTVQKIATIVAWFAYAGASGFALTAAATKRDSWRTAAIAVTAVGFGAQIVGQVAIVTALHRAPWGSLYEWVCTVTLLIVGFTLFYLLPRKAFTAVSGFVLMFAMVFVLSAAYLYVPPGPLMPALRSNWLTFHVALAILGSTLLLTGGVVSALYVVRLGWEEKQPQPALRAEPSQAAALAGVERALVGVGATGALSQPDTAAFAPPPPPVTANRPDNVPQAVEDSSGGGFRAALPSAARLDELARKVFTLAFPIWTLAIFAGAVWGEQAWGRYWGWDPKETTSFIIWGLFAAYLHARATRGWRGRKAAILGMVGASMVLFNVFVVNLVISGLHSYAGV